MNDITIKLNIFERKFLLMLSERGGNQDMDPNSVSIDVWKALEDLSDKGAIDIIPIVNSYMYSYRLTNVGTNLVDLIKRIPND